MTSESLDTMRATSTLLCFSRMAMHSQPEVTTPRVVCSTSGRTKNLAFTATTTSSAVSPVSLSVSRVDFCWLGMMTSTAMSGMLYVQKEQVYWLVTIILCHAWGSLKMVWPSVLGLGTPSSRSGTRNRWRKRRRRRRRLKRQRRMRIELPEVDAEALVQEE